MGRVVLVHDVVLGRDVAMKEIVPGQEGAAFAARLEREAAITARLEHPNIVPVYDAGYDVQRGPYYTMRVVRGRSLADVVRESPERASRLRLLNHVLAASQAVAWAHRHGIVHRDLKPSNVMVGEFGETQVVDWGLARAIVGSDFPIVRAAQNGPTGPTGHAGPAASMEAIGAEPESEDPNLTAWGSVVGTPHYMSPEQAMGETVDARSDVWALGFIIYEVVTGRPVRDPSSASDVIAQARSGLPMLALDELPGELAAIVRRATETRRERRYPEAKELADDLANWLEGRRVTAHSYTPWELLRRVVSAWRVPLVIVGLALVALAVAIGLGFRSTTLERVRAEAAEARATSALGLAEAELGRALVESSRALASDGRRPEAEIMAAVALGHLETPEARGVLASLATGPRPRLVATHVLPVCEGITLSSDGLELLCRGEDALSRHTLGVAGPRWRRAGASSFVAWFEREGRVLVNGTQSGSEVLDAATGQSLGKSEACCNRLQSTLEGDVVFGFGQQTLEVVRDAAGPSELIASTCKEVSVFGAFERIAGHERWLQVCFDGRFRAQDSRHGQRTGELLAPAGHDLHFGVALVPGADGALIGSNSGELAYLELSTGALRWRRQVGVGVVGPITVSPDGSVAAFRDGARGIAICDVVNGHIYGRLPATEDLGLRFLAGHPSRLATWGRGRVTTWDLEGGLPATIPLEGGAAALDVSRDGRLLAVGTSEHLEVFALSSGARVVARREGVVVKSVLFSPDGARVAAGLGHVERRVAVVLVDGSEPYELGPVGFTRRLASASGGRVLRVGDFGPYQLLDWDGEPIATEPTRHADHDLAVSADGRHAVLLRDEARRAVIADLGVAPLWRELAAESSWAAAAPDSYGLRWAFVSGSTVEVVDEYGELVAVFAGDRDAQLTDVAWSPDDRWVASGTRRGVVYVWSAADRALRLSIHAHADQVGALAFDPLGRWLASASWDGTVRFASLAVIGPSPAMLRAEAERNWASTWDAMVRAR